MKDILLVSRCLLFFLSSFGYWNWIKEKTRISVYYLPVVTVAGQIFVLFVAGLLNLLPQATIVLFFGGLLLFGKCCYKKKLVWLNDYKNWGYLFLFGSVALVAIVLRGCIFTHYDNFSHWALVVKEMLRLNQYPTFKNPLVTFQAYPLGSSTYIYYFAKIIGTQESVQMLAQAYMILTCALPLFSLAKKYVPLIAVFILLLSQFFFVYNTWIGTLLVDTLLPMFGAAMILFAYEECYLPCSGTENCAEKTIRVRLLWLIPLLVSVMQIKNSGIYFVAVVMILLFMLFRQYKTDEVLKRNVLLCAVSPFISKYLWSKHCAYVFEDAAASKHAMTAENYIAEVANKSMQDIQLITQKMLAFSFQGTDLWLIVASVLCLGGLIYLCRRDQLRHYGKVAAALGGIYIAYMIGLWAMYIFSMPGGEALELAGSVRYRRTILIVIVYFLVAFTIKQWSEIADLKKFLAVYVLAAALLAVLWSNSSGRATILEVRNKEQRQQRDWIEEQIATYQVLPGKSYVYCIPQDDYGYLSYMGRYLLNSRDIAAAINVTEDWFDTHRPYQYVFVMDPENEELQRWIQKNYPEQLGNSVIVTGEDEAE